MGEHPKVTGLTLNYRDSARTIQSVNSLLRAGACHVLIWDNSQDDGYSAKELDVKTKSNSRISIYRSSVNLGFAIGVNRGIEWLYKHFPHTWVLLINNDAIITSNGIKELAKGLVNNSQAVIAYPNIKNGTITHGTLYYHRYSGLLSRKSLPGFFPYASGCCQLVATDRLTSSKLFEEDFFMYGDDVELGYRLGINQYVHINKTLVFHEGSASSQNGSFFYETNIIKSHFLLAEKLSTSKIDFYMIALTRIVIFSLRAITRSIRMKSLIPLYALINYIYIYRNNKNK